MSSIYTNVISSIIFPMHERLKGHTTVQVRKQMEQSQWWDLARLNDFRINRLRELLLHAKMHVPYYKEMFNQYDFKPENVNALSDLEKLPLLSKEIIRINKEDLMADNAVGLARFNTGGSSGEPLVFFIGKERISHDVAAKWRATRWWDVDIGDPEIVVWGSPIELGSQDYVRIIRDRLLRTSLLPAFEMSNSKVEGFIEQIRQIKPKMLFGYPSALAHIASLARKRGQAMNDLGIKVAFVTSERLYDHQREIIEQVFGCKVANGYGGRDAGFIAHQCPQGGMHITVEDLIVEIIDSEGRVLPVGESGEIVVTHLATRGFPFIRYRTGDVGVLGKEQCACGRNLPLLTKIEGRTTDFLVTQDGTVMHGLALIYIIREIGGIEYFKIIQESLSKTLVLLVTNNKYSKNNDNVIIEGFKSRLGLDVEIDLKKVDEISPEKSGKYRYIISKVVVN